MFFLAVIYLGLAFYANTFGNNESALKKFLNTDGLTLAGIIVTFIYTILSKSSLFYILLNKIFLRTKMIDYKLVLIFGCLTDTINLDEFKKHFDENLKRYKDYDELKIEPKGGQSKASKKYYYRNVFSNVIYESDYENKEVSLSLDGGVKFNLLTDIIKFIVLKYLEAEEINKKIFVKRILLKLNINNSEIKISNYCVNEYIQKFQIVNANIILSIDEHTSIHIRQNDIEVNSLNKGSFYSSYEEINKIICNSI